MKRRRSKQPLLRLPATETRALTQLVNGANWSPNKALAFLVRAGWNALNCGADEIPAMRNVMANAVLHQETTLAMKKRLALTARKLREAQSALTKKTGGVA